MNLSFISRPAAWFVVLAGSAVLLLAVSACSDDGGQPSGETPEPTEAEESALSESPEYILAVANAGGTVDEDDPTIDEFRTVLDTLEEKCPNERQEIAEIGIGTHESVTERGLEITLLQMMRDLSDNIPPDLAVTGISCAVAFAAYVQSEAPQ